MDTEPHAHQDYATDCRNESGSLFVKPSAIATAPEQAIDEWKFVENDWVLVSSSNLGADT